MRHGVPSAAACEKTKVLEVVAKAIIVLAALYLLLLGAVALLRPQRAGAFLLGFATAPGKHYTELAVRVLVGGALLLLARTSPYAMPLTVFGWVLVASTAVMAVMPWQVHRRFAEASVPRALRYLPLIGVASLAMGIALLGAVLRTR